ncbi:MAG: LytTR family DNA-binding domain-containing protein [Sphingobium sp.]
MRRTLLEIWIVLPLAGLVGFMGPFGTYLMGDFLARSGRWLLLLLGAYVLVRPTMVFWNWVARATRLPHGSVLIWGLTVSSLPMAVIWRLGGAQEIRMLGSYTGGVLPFALLCSLTILLVAWLAERADEHLQRTYGGPIRQWRAGVETVVAPPAAAKDGEQPPRLFARLGPRFVGPVLALESEDHYVRVHGRQASELVLMRLRDAIAEMDGMPGEQTHRSWWVARDAVTHVNRTGRTLEIVLANGEKVPVARDSVDRLEASGFLPARNGAGQEA